MGEKKDGHAEETRPQKKRENAGAAGVEQQEIHEVNTDFMKEEIRRRPINRRRLARRTVITVMMAILFGAIACLVFILLEPVINSALNPTEETEKVSFPEDEIQEEMSPEEMIADDQQIQEAAAEEIAANSVDSITQEVLDEVRGQLEEEVQKQIEQADSTKEEGEDTPDTQADLQDTYEGMITSLREITENVENSMVTVTAITSDYDWVGDAYDSTGSVSGLIIAERGDDLLILADNGELAQAEEVLVTFADDQQAAAVTECSDPITGLVVLAVSGGDLETPLEENDSIAVCTLGNSGQSGLNGSLVIAVGSPTGAQGSVSYGIITNTGLALDVTDEAFRQITTDIYGSTRAGGVLADTQGRILGWIDMDSSSSDTPNMISAIGISELKGLVENMSNGIDMGYLGIHGTDVPENVAEEQGIPVGSYVVRTELDSPAMDAGIQSGDVIVSLNGNEISSHDDVVEILEQTTAGKYLSVTVMRNAQDGWEEVDLTVRLTQRFEMASP